MQIKLIDKDGNQCISTEVKRRKLLNNLPPYMEETLMPQIKDDWTYEDIVEKAESYEAAKRGRNPSGSTNGSRTKDRTLPTPQKKKNKDWNQERKTGFNPSHNPRSNPGKGKTRNLDWDTINKTLTQTDKERLIKDKKCLWCRIPGHTFKECKKRLQKEPIRTAAQHMTTRVLPTKAIKGTKRIPIKPVVEPQDYSKIEVKANGFTALALVNL